MSTFANFDFRRTSEDTKLRQELAAAIDADAASNFLDDPWRRDMYQDMVEVIWRGFNHESLIELMSTVETPGEFERVTADEVTGLEPFWVSAGGQIDASRIDVRTWELPPDWIGYHVYEFVDKIRSGFARYQGRLIPSAVNQMDAAVNSRLLRTYVSAIPGVSSDSYLTSVGFDLSLVNTAITEVEDDASSEPDLMDPTIAIIGRGTMIDEFLNALQDDNVYAPETNQAIIRLGLLGTYRGANLIKLRNWKDRHGTPFFPRNELLIVSTAAAKTAFWSADKAEQWIPPGSGYWHATGSRKVNCMVHRPWLARRYVDTDKLAV